MSKALPILLVLAPAALVAIGLVAKADDCVDTSLNNPAFSSPYATTWTPCPKPRTQAEPSKTPSRSGTGDHRSPDKRGKPDVAAARPQADPDKATVTHTPTGTLMKFGETTVCVSGSITADIHTGNAAHRTDASTPSTPMCQ